MNVIDYETPVIHIYPRYYDLGYDVVLIDLAIKDSILKFEDCPVMGTDRGVISIKLAGELEKDRTYYIKVFRKNGDLVYKGKGTTYKEGKLVNNDIIRL